MSNKGRTPDNDERSLWDRFVDGIKPMHKRTVEIPSAQPSKSSKKPYVPIQNRIENGQPRPQKPTDNMLDGKTLSRLKKGKMPIEGKIDLHNKTQDQAYAALKSFVASAHQSQKRCVLVVTGKGVNTRADDILTSKRDGVGVLKSRLPEWVSTSPLSDMVLRAQPAHRTHGGDGAFYLYLKRKQRLRP